MKNQKSKFPTTEDLVSSKTQKPERKKREKVWQMEEIKDGVFEVPKELDSFQRPETVQLKEVGDWIHGLYEGIQPVEYKKTGGMGYLILLRQQDNSLKAISAGYDIRRWLLESGFDELLGEYIKITLENFVDTSNGQLAPMKQYRFDYSKKVAAMLKQGSKLNLRMIEAKNNPAVALIEDAKKLKSFSPVLEVEKEED